MTDKKEFTECEYGILTRENVEYENNEIRAGRSSGDLTLFNGEDYYNLKNNIDKLIKFDGKSIKSILDKNDKYIGNEVIVIENLTTEDEAERIINDSKSIKTLNYNYIVCFINGEYLSDTRFYIRVWF